MFDTVRSGDTRKPSSRRLTPGLEEYNKHSASCCAAGIRLAACDLCDRGLSFAASRDFKFLLRTSQPIHENYTHKRPLLQHHSRLFFFLHLPLFANGAFDVLASAFSSQSTVSHKFQSPSHNTLTAVSQTNKHTPPSSTFLAIQTIPNLHHGCLKFHPGYRLLVALFPATSSRLLRLRRQ